MRSDWQTNIHVLQYTDQGPTKLRDIRADDFVESWWWRFRWLDLDGRTLAIVAEATERPHDPCHGCPKFHSYRAYRWNESRGTFILSETIPSTGELHRDDGDPLETDWDYIVARLKDG